MSFPGLKHGSDEEEELFKEFFETRARNARNWGASQINIPNVLASDQTQPDPQDQAAPSLHTAETNEQRIDVHAHTAGSSKDTETKKRKSTTDAAEGAAGRSTSRKLGSERDESCERSTEEDEADKVQASTSSLQSATESNGVLDTETLYELLGSNPIHNS